MNITRALSTAVIGVATIGSLGFALPVFAQGPDTGSRSEQNAPRPAVVGIVSSISGTSLTVTTKGWERGAAATSSATYIVDAANATITKNGVNSSLPAITIGDRVMVRGSVIGTKVTATSVNDGRMLGRRSMMGRGIKADTATSTRPMMNIPTGNGEPVIAGSVTAVNGTTLTVTTKSGTAYTVQAASTTIMRMGAVSALSNVASGDTVVVQGAVNGTSVTASSLIDQGTPPSGGEGSEDQGSGEGRGFFHAMGGFFMHMFGF